ncbi:glycoside hydrolase family 88/105 protein [Steroidobacter agaridevorans]|uniref:glycoside hydrolase family 88/105 protein n=1 Tax=Steroidobacter agaridevorans TaxID=2695856 RepID=UPI001328BB9F|nr:glycoside hydrolase family 88 protein [Steroidobacter agaridevorans]GFE90006.1 glycosyl hydrolase family 88 [Steroidobacter agaridevorans]
MERLLQTNAIRSLCALAMLATASAALAQSQPTQIHTSPRVDPGVYSGRLTPNYPTPYQPATTQSIEATLQRVHAYLEQAAPLRVVNGATGAEVSDLKKLPDLAALDRTDLLILTYEWGVTYSGMLLAADVTGDTRYRKYTQERLAGIATLAAHAKKHLAADGSVPAVAHGMSMRSIVKPRSLDDAGSMCAAMIKANRAGLGNDLRPWIDNYVQFVSGTQFRLADGTLARNRPLPESLWLDDLYMSVPCLAQAGKLTGDNRYFDDAVKQILQFSERMFVQERGLFMHGWVQGMQPHPVFPWGRANGWATMAMVELLEVLPETHPGRARILEIYRTHAAALAAAQGHAGLWHQLLDRRESYEETSASAMFVYALARGINRGWLDARAFGPAVSLGWNAVTTKVNAKGQVEGTCVGTGMGWDPMFYMYRPVHVLAAHGYGPVFLAGAEMIALLRAQADVVVNDGGVHFGKATSPH